MNLRINDEWDTILNAMYQEDFYQKLESFIMREYKTYNVFPEKEDLFLAFRLTSFFNIKAVIIGQDPYHQPGQAHGLVFSVPEGTKLPPSLKNIYKELSADLGIAPPVGGYLKPWAEEGVLLLNTILTVRAGEPLSHKNKGWENFTRRIITLINKKEEPVVFILWGRYACAYEDIITSSHHLVLKGAHPSPLSAFNGFFGGRYFSRCNAFLKSHNIKEINWQI